MKARIVKKNGCYRIFAQRAKRKWWFELGRHKTTDAQFEAALAAGTVEWCDRIKGEEKLF